MTVFPAQISYSVSKIGTSSLQRDDDRLLHVDYGYCFNHFDLGVYAASQTTFVRCGFHFELDGAI